MSKTRETKQIESLVFRKYFIDYGQRCAFEVRFSDWKHKIRGRVDFVAVDREDKFTFVEIKQSLQDFNGKTGHNLYGDRNYYAMTRDLYEKVKDKIPKGVGVLVKQEQKHSKFLGCRLYEMQVVKRCGKIDYKLTDRQRLRLKKDMFTACNSTIHRLLRNYRYDITNKELFNKHKTGWIRNV
jgi:hypothetical protein